MASDVHPPRGMRDFLPADKAVRDGVIASIRESFSCYGYQEIETPVAEDISRLESGEGGDNEKLVFKILKRGLAAGDSVVVADAADLGLRFDLTVPLSRFFATHRPALPSVFRSIQIAPVWRAERPQKGRYRQFTQCDIDVLGEASNLAEVELITATTAAVERLGIAETWVRINDRRVLAALLDACQIPPASQPGVLITIDKLDKVGISGVADELRAEGGGPDVDMLIGVLESLAGGGGTSTAGFDATVAALPGAGPDAAAGIAEIRSALAATAPRAALVFDPTLVRGMGYYTGTIFELMHPSSSGSVGGGGRYDGMIGRFAGVEVPACGFSIGFERIVDLVDPGRFRPSRRQVAVVYDAELDPGVVVAWQQRLIDEDATVRLVRRARNQGRVLDELAADGFAAYLDLGAGAIGPQPGGAVPELRPISLRL